jgi:hypothetical protein
MKYKILIITLLASCCMNAAYAQWKLVYKSKVNAAGDANIYSDGEHIIANVENGLKITIDNGKSWKVIDTTSRALEMHGKIIRKDSLLFLLGDSGVYFSADSGFTWKKSGGWKFHNYYSNDIEVSGKNILVAMDKAKVVLSTDNGATWDTSNTGLLPSLLNPGSSRPQYRIFSGYTIIEDKVFCWQDDKEFISNDHGLSWHYLKDSCNCKFGVTLGKNVVAGSGDQNGAFICILHNMGATWEKVFFPKVPADAIGVWAAKGGYVFGTVENEGVIMSKDSGLHWVFINDTLKPWQLDFYNMTITSNYLYFGSGYSGKIFRRPLSEVFGLNTTEHPSQDLLSLKIYPNPMQHSATMEFGREIKEGNLVLYDINGKEVQNIKNIREERIILYRNNLPSGLYIYMLIEGNTWRAFGKIEIN